MIPRTVKVFVLVLVVGAGIGTGVALSVSEPPPPPGDHLPMEGGPVPTSALPDVVQWVGRDGQARGWIPNPALYDVPFPPPSHLVFALPSQAQSAVKDGVVAVASATP
jgi:hypothetical protein